MIGKLEEIGRSCKALSHYSYPPLLYQRHDSDESEEYGQEQLPELVDDEFCDVLGGLPDYEENEYAGSSNPEEFEAMEVFNTQ